MASNGFTGITEHPPQTVRSWNQLLPDQQTKIIDIATVNQDWPCRQICFYITDHEGFSVSKSTVYRIWNKKASAISWLLPDIFLFLLCG